MIIPLAGIVLGILIGAFRAKRRGGKTADLVQWALVYALALGLVGLFVMIGIDRSYRG